MGDLLRGGHSEELRRGAESRSGSISQELREALISQRGRTEGYRNGLSELLPEKLGRNEVFFMAECAFLFNFFWEQGPRALGATAICPNERTSCQHVSRQGAS